MKNVAEVGDIIELEGDYFVVESVNPLILADIDTL